MQHSSSFIEHHLFDPSWQQEGTLFWRGYVFQSDSLLDLEEIAEQLGKCHTPKDLKQVLLTWNGCFALYWQGTDFSFAAVDIGRTIPLFWSTKKKTIIRDSLPPNLANESSSFSQWMAQNWLANTTFVPGNDTLLQDWQQIKAGEFLWINENGAQLETWFTHHRLKPFMDGFEKLKNTFSGIAKMQIQRLIQWADGRKIVIPLSGGYDSRFLLAALHQAGYQNIQTFTYGQPDSWEVKVAREVAQRLGVEWHFVAYNIDLLRNFFKDDWKNYALKASNFTSLPQDQDFYALQVLKQKGILEAGSIILPGYCGDFQAGSYHPKAYFQLPWRKTKALQMFLFYKFNKYPNTENWTLIADFLPQNSVNNQHEIISEIEDWVLREYVSKYILNGLRAYEYFDCQWYLPLWDKAFIQFWQKVPNEFRREMQLYRTVLEEEYFKPLNLVFKEDILPVERFNLKNYLSLLWQHKIKQQFPSKPFYNVNGFHELSLGIQQQLAWPTLKKELNSNEVAGWWLMEEFRKMSAS